MERNQTLLEYVMTLDNHQRFKFLVEFYPDLAKLRYKGKNRRLTNEEFFNEKLSTIPLKAFKLEDLLSQLCIVNRMVKSSNCPSRVRNYVYHAKFVILKELLHNGFVNKISYTNPVLSFQLKNGQLFHQLPSCYPNIKIEELDCSQPFVGGEVLEYNQREFHKFKRIIKYHGSIRNAVYDYIKKNQ